MKNRIVKLLLVFILLFSVGVSKVHADAIFDAVPTVEISELKSSGLITYDWRDGSSGTDHQACVNSPSYSCKTLYENWNMYSAIIGDRYIA